MCCCNSFHADATQFPFLRSFASQSFLHPLRAIIDLIVYHPFCLCLQLKFMLQLRIQTPMKIDCKCPWCSFNTLQEKKNTPSEWKIYISIFSKFIGFRPFSVPCYSKKKAKRTNWKKRKLAEWSKKLLKIKYDFVRPEPFGYRQMFIQ